MNEQTEQKKDQKPSYLESLQNFGEHVKASKDEMLEILNTSKGDYEDRFNIKIEMNGKSTEIELHADAYDRLMTMLEAEITEYMEAFDHEA